MNGIEWKRDGAGWQATMPDNVTLFASPDRTKGVLGDKPARGTAWKAGASQWDESTRTMSRYGRDCYRESCKTAKEAMSLAASVYNAAKESA